MKVEPTKDWSQKYTMDASIGTLDAKEVATCSRHILEVCEIDQNTKHTRRYINHGHYYFSGNICMK